ncbi:MAG: helix-turn-helix domain-containing protein [Pseudomonadota bacterium]
MQLRGFDEFEVTLGDEMRGERASLGKSLEDAERDLRIKAHMITAIENCDLSGFPNQSVIAGYVRSYSRYLGMNAEDCYQRFCEESGYQSPAALMSTLGDGSGYGSLNKPAVTSGVGAGIANSRFAAPPPQMRFQARVSLGALSSTLALIALIAGLCYGGYALLQDLQRIGIAPVPEAPAVVADAPEFSEPAVDQRRFVRPTAEDYQGGGTLAALQPQAELPNINKLRRDGPISAIDPNKSSLFARIEEPPMPSSDQDIAMGDDLDVEPIIDTVDIIAAETGSAIAEKPPADDIEGIVLHAVDTAWIRVRDASKATIWEGILEAGQRYTLPERVEEPEMRTGCPSNTFVFLDGILYGPMGSGCNPKNISLIADNVRSTIPEAEAEDIERARATEILQRAEAQLSRQ